MTRRWVPAAVLTAAVAGILAVAGSAVGGGLTYYQTPTELLHEPVDGEVRLSGMVVPGTVRQSDTRSELRISDGATEVLVTYAGPLPAVVHEGEGAVVTGRITSDGTLAASEVVLRHSNEYRSAP